MKLWMNTTSSSERPVLDPHLVTGRLMPLAALLTVRLTFCYISDSFGLAVFLLIHNTNFSLILLPSSGLSCNETRSNGAQNKLPLELSKQQLSLA